ncbi:MAG: FtsW/RodA/SpoVE family cell cycle protein [Muribaculaceae bacterium]|nr:FtsW/RodA/SpoVE family cell cycle protein [Muribaculaceae bacterium]
MAETKKVNKYEEVTKKYGDPWIWGIYFTLIIISIIESYSASSREVATSGVYMPIIKHCIFLAVGFGCIFFLHKTNYNNKNLLALMIPGLGIFTVISLIYVMLFGEVINGAQRAITLPGGFTLQPAELAKLSIVTLLAYILARSQKNKDVSLMGIIGAAVIVGVFGGLLLQSGLTNTLLLMCISLSMLLIGGTRMKKLVTVLVIYGIVFGCFMLIKKNNDSKEANLLAAENVVMEGDTIADNVTTEGGKAKVDRSGTWKSRVKEWWNKDSLVYRPLTDKNQQEMFSRMAQAHGGLTGVGIGNSRECSRLPLAFSDYIYSIIIEETGLIGGIFVLILFLWLLARAAMIARRCRRVLPALLIIGMASMIAFQALFHMAINSGVFPVSGQPLPLVSKGGTSIIVTSIAFGIMLSVSRTIANGNTKSNKSEENQLPEGLGAENPTQLIRKNEWK